MIKGYLIDVNTTEKDSEVHEATYMNYQARTYLQLLIRQWGVDNVYLLVLFSWKANIAENPIAVMGL